MFGFNRRVLRAMGVVLESLARIEERQDIFGKALSHMAKVTEEILAYSAKIDEHSNTIAEATTAIKTRIEELIAGGSLPEEAKAILQEDVDRLALLASALTELGKTPGEVPPPPPVE